ncbi:MAG: TlpA family protein disulfide reductase [Chloroflexi bacterium]|nr:TlpA family protein disulfide reductase [Chloroflexota bacterium]
MARLHEEYKGRNVQVVALNVIPASGEAAFLAWMKKYKGGDLVYATDSRLQVAQAYGVQYLGESVFIDRKEQIATRALPPGLSYEQMKQIVDQLLQ